MAVVRAGIDFAIATTRLDHKPVMQQTQAYSEHYTSLIESYPDISYSSTPNATYQCLDDEEGHHLPRSLRNGAHQTDRSTDQHLQVICGGSDSVILSIYHSRLFYASYTQADSIT